MAMTWKVTEHMIFLLSLAVICSFSHCHREQEEDKGMTWEDVESMMSNKTLKADKLLALVAVFLEHLRVWAKYLMEGIQFEYDLDAMLHYTSWQSEHTAPWTERLGTLLPTSLHSLHTSASYMWQVAQYIIRKRAHGYKDQKKENTMPAPSD